MRIVDLAEDGRVTRVELDDWDRNAIECYEALLMKGWSEEEALHWCLTYCVLADPLVFSVYVDR